MAEYINKAELLWLMNETKEDRLTREVIENHPTIDVVHCEECKHYEGNYVSGKCKNERFEKYYYATIVGADFFCKDGERKE